MTNPINYLDVAKSAIAFNSLPHINDILSEPVKEKILREAAAVFSSQKKHARYSLSRLHKHFDLDADELLLEHFNEKNDSIVVEAIKASRLEGYQLSPTSWTISPSLSRTGTPSFTPYIYKIKNKSDSIYEENDDEFFKLTAEFLIRNNACTAHGINFSYGSYESKQASVLHERTYVDEKIQVSQFIPRSQINKSTVVTTSWCFLETKEPTMKLSPFETFCVVVASHSTCESKNAGEYADWHEQHHGTTHKSESRWYPPSQ
jgi:hypothetical protein